MDAILLFELVMVLIIVGFLFYFCKKFDKFSISHGPEILTTLGILGCFIGITKALWQIDTSNLIKSMPALLEGVKFAFISSIFGVFSAIIIRLVQRNKMNKQTDNKSNNVNYTEEVTELLKVIKQGLIGSEQDTLLTHLKLMRQEQKDNSHELIKEFKSFAAHMVENNQKAIIEALKEVIKDFNQNLTDQFGENFKQLNSSVEKLVLWQAQYKDELEEIKIAQQQTAVNMKIAVDEMEKFVTNSESFSNVSKDLSNQITFLESNRDILIMQQQSLADLLSKLSEVTPQFSDKANAMLDTVMNGMNHITQESLKLTNQLKENSEKNHSELQKSMESIANSLSNSISQVLKNLENQLSQFNTELKNLFTQSIKENQEQIKNTLNENLNIIKGGVTLLDKTLQEELNKALEGLGRQLSSLSAKFVEDYAPLTDRLREIVRIAEGA